jgi:hypothetical protein
MGQRNKHIGLTFMSAENLFQWFSWNSGLGKTQECSAFLSNPSMNLQCQCRKATSTWLAKDIGGLPLGSVGCYRVRSRISNSKFLYQNLQGNIIWVFESTDLTLKTPTDPKGNPPLDPGWEGDDDLCTTLQRGTPWGIGWRLLLYHLTHDATLLLMSFHICQTIEKHPCSYTARKAIQDHIADSYWIHLHLYIYLYLHIGM